MILKFRLNSLIQYHNLVTQATTKVGVRTAVKLSFKVIGEGTTEPEEPPIFLLHGLLGNKKHWKGLGKTIWNMTKRTIVIVDLRNHGSSPHITSQSYDDMAGDMIYLLDRLSVDRASILGHNIGGRTALCVSLLAPKRVAGIVVEDMSPITTSEDFMKMEVILTAMKEVDFKNPRKVSHAKKEAKRQLKDLVIDDLQMNTILSNVRVTHDGRINWICNLDTMVKQFKQLASFPITEGKIYEGPCLFIGATSSGYIPPGDHVQIKKLFPNAEFRYIKNTGTNLHIEDPKTFLEIAIEFLRRNH